MATFVLISGAWHGAWCWERVTPLLVASGHIVVTPELLGMGQDPTPVAGVTLSGWSNQIAKIVDSLAEPVILVGHSRGGIVISEVAERVPEKVSLLIYLSALLLPNGSAILESAARFPQANLGEIMEVHPDDTVTIKPDAVGPTFYNTTAPDWVTRAKSLLSAEPMAGLTTPVHVTEQRFGSIPRAFIECTQDRAVPIELQRSLQQELPCRRVITLNSDHSPFYSDHKALANILDSLARS